MSKVEFRDISGFPGYCVGNNGTVWSKWGKGCNSKMREEWKKLKPIKGKNGRHHVSLHRKGTSFRRYVHHLVLEAFVGPCPKGMQCAHWDGNPLNNHLDNLRWATRKENEADKIRHGTANRGERCNFSRLTEKQILEIRRMYKQGWKQQVIGDKFGIEQSHVSHICSRKIWSHVA